MQADLSLFAGRQCFLFAALGSGCFLCDALTGEEELNQNTDKGNDDQCNDEDLPVILGSPGVIDRGARFVDVIQNFAGIVGNRCAFSAHVIDEEQMQEEGQHHGTKPHGSKHGGIGDRGKQAAVFAVAGREADKRGMRGVVHRVGKCKPEVIADGNAYQCTCMPRIVCSIIRAEYEQKQQRNQAERDRKQQKRSCFTCFGYIVVHQAADNDVADYNEDHRYDRQPGEESACPVVDVQDIGHVLVEIVRHDGVGQQGKRRTGEIADCPFREQRYIVFSDQARWKFFVKPGQTAFLTHDDPPYR